MSKLTFYFKSGNQVTIDKVKSWKFTLDSNLDINVIEILQPKEGFFRCKKRMIVKTINFKSIECVVEH